MKDRMDVRSPKGTKVMVTEETARSGYGYDVKKVNDHLVIGRVYTVERTIAGQWQSEVVLKEVPGVKFNAVNFIPVGEPQKKPSFSYSKCHNTYTKEGSRDAALEVIEWFKQQLLSDGEIDEIDVEHLFRHLEAYEYFRQNPGEEEFE